jgi:hypothetical protein
MIVATKVRKHHSSPQPGGNDHPWTSRAVAQFVAHSTLSLAGKSFSIARPGEASPCRFQSFPHRTERNGHEPLIVFFLTSEPAFCRPL